MINTLETIGGEGLALVNAYGRPLISVLVIVVVGIVVAKWMHGLLLASCERGGVDATLAHFLSKLLRWAILLIAVILALNAFGINTASFAVVLGTVGLAVGLAFQGTLSNFASGLMLMIFRPYQIADIVTVAGQTGVVAEIDLFSTTLDTADRRRIIVPNSSIFGSVITNTSTHPIRRADVNVRVIFRADIDATRQVLMEAALATPGRTAEVPDIGLLELGSLGVEWQVRVWCLTGDHLAVRQALLREVKIALDRAGIAIAQSVVDSPTPR